MFSPMNIRSLFCTKYVNIYNLLPHQILHVVTIWGGIHNSGTGAAIFTAIIVARLKYTEYKFKYIQVHKIPHSWVDVLIFYVFLFGVLYGLMLPLFHDGFNSECASDFMQISEKAQQRPWQWLDKHLRKKVWSVRGCLNGMLGSGQT
jgi:hypothetical protein